MPDTMNFEVRRAGLADADEIAAAHLDSIRSIGARYYDAAIVNDWAGKVRPGEHILWSGRSMPCVCMRKSLAKGTARP